MGVDEGGAEYFLSDWTEILLRDHDAAYCRDVAGEDDHIAAGEKVRHRGGGTDFFSRVVAHSEERYAYKIFPEVL